MQILLQAGKLKKLSNSAHRISHTIPTPTAFTNPSVVIRIEGEVLLDIDLVRQ